MFAFNLNYTFNVNKYQIIGEIAQLTNPLII